MFSIIFEFLFSKTRSSVNNNGHGASVTMAGYAAKFSYFAGNFSQATRKQAVKYVLGQWVGCSVHERRLIEEGFVYSGHSLLRGTKARAASISFETHDKRLPFTRRHHIFSYLSLCFFPATKKREAVKILAGTCASLSSRKSLKIAENVTRHGKHWIRRSWPRKHR